mgnify:CR=1 FL=1
MEEAYESDEYNACDEYNEHDACGAQIECDVYDVFGRQTPGCRQPQQIISTYGTDPQGRTEKKPFAFFPDRDPVYRSRNHARYAAFSAADE